MVRVKPDRGVRTKLGVRSSRGSSRLLVLLLAVAVGGGVYLSLVLGDGVGNTGTSQQNQGDIFTGTILNKPLEGKAEGVVIADLDCRGSMTAITCRAIIDSDKSRLEFQYTHNMEQQPCLAPGDKVVVEPLKSGSKTFLRRLS